ncbi:MAG TPA: histidine kinase, partial [Burkholderiaceae bacterium]|nr:histidine kinase [Burkholderiaceae bacterium]
MAEAQITTEADKSTLQRRQTEGAQAPVIPDFCNFGIALRTLVPLIAAALILSIALSRGAVDAGWRFLHAATILVPAVLASLVALCAARRLVNDKAFALQWVAAIGVPAALTLGVSLAVQPFVEPDLFGAALAYWVASRALVAAAVAYLFVEYFHLRARAFSPSFSEARLQALQARIRPHFLFNSLNTVLALMRRDPRRAEATLENLADLFRVFMRDARELVALDDEVVTCKEYLAIEQLRLGERLRVQWD